MADFDIKGHLLDGAVSAEVPQKLKILLFVREVESTIDWLLCRVQLEDAKIHLIFNVRVEVEQAFKLILEVIQLIFHLKLLNKELLLLLLEHLFPLLDVNLVETCPLVVHFSPQTGVVVLDCLDHLFSLIGQL